MRRLALALALQIALFGQVSSPIFPGPGVSSGASTAPAVTGKTCSNQNSGTTSQACTWSSAPSAGETIYCNAANFVATASFSFTDNGSTPNTYTANQAIKTISATRGYQLFTAPVVNSPTTTTVSATTSMSFIFLGCISVTSGFNMSDATVVSTSGSGTTQTMTTTTATAGSVIICTGWGTTGTLTAGTGLTLVTGTFPNNRIEYEKTTTSGGYTTAIGNGTSTTMDLVCGAYK